MRETGERTGRGSEAPGWAMHRSEIAIVEGDLEAALTAVRPPAARSWSPSKAGSTPSGSTCARPPCCWSAAGWTRRRRCWSATPTRWSAGWPPARSPGCGPCAWRWRPGAATCPRPGSPWTATGPPRPGRAGAPSTATWASTAPSPPCGPGCPGRGAPAGRRHRPGRPRSRPLEPASSRPPPPRGGHAGGHRRPGRRPGGLPAGAGPRRRLPGPFLLADCHQGAARCLLALGDHPGAADHARRAAQLLERWPGWRREEAALLAEGLSNGEIARRLYISTKTASVHVSNILAKLNMTSRTEVATWALRSGLVPPDAPQMPHRP